MITIKVWIASLIITISMSSVATYFLVRSSEQMACQKILELQKHNETKSSVKQKYVPINYKDGKRY